MSFQWQTEEERSWEETVSDEETVAKQPRRRWPWLLALTALALVGLALGWRAVNDRVQEATALVEEDVLSSHQLAQQAASQRDRELFVTLLSGRSQPWTEVQKQRLEDGLLFGQTARLLGMSPLAGPGQGSAITFNAELTEAVLSVEAPFAVEVEPGITETVILTQTAVYRKGNQRWLLSPPEPEFWGEWQMTSGEMSRVVYSQRDEAIALRLAEDIDDVIVEMCLATPLCPPRLDVHLRLETDPGSVLSARHQMYQSPENELLLPTPTLVGLPAGEQAYQALFRGYASYVVGWFLLNTAGYKCCEHILFQQALVELQLADLRLAPQPLRPDDYLHFVETAPDLDRLRVLWNQAEMKESDPAPPVEIYSFLTFLKEENGSPQSGWREMQLALNTEASFWRWLGAVSGYDPARQNELEQAWLEFAREQVLRNQTTSTMPATLSLPQQDVIGVCGNETLDVYRYDLQRATWEMELEQGFEHAFLAVLPDDSGFILPGAYQQDGEQQIVETWLKRGDQEPVLIAGEGTSNYLILAWSQHSPDGQRLFAWIPTRNGGESPTFILLDPAECYDGGCRYEVIPGIPFSSPGAESTIYSRLDDTLYLRHPGSASYEELGQGQTPFWVDDETFVYVRPGRIGREQSIVAATLQNSEGQELITTEALRRMVPDPLPVHPLYVDWAGRDPYESNQILLILSAGALGSQSHVFALRRPDRTRSWAESELEVSWLHSFDGALFRGWFPDRSNASATRWLVFVLRVSILESERRVLAWYDLKQKKIVRVFSELGPDLEWAEVGDWTSDGEWYVHAVPGAAVLLAPIFLEEEQPFRYVIPHDFERCAAFAWIN